MRLGFNCLDLDSNYLGGVNTFALGLLRGLISSRGADEVVIFATPQNKHLFSQYEGVEGCKVVVLSDPMSPLKRLIRRCLRFLWAPFLVRMASNLAFANVTKTIETMVDVVYFPTTVLFPYNFKIPTFVSMHDIQQVHFPEFFSWKERLARRSAFQLTAKYVSRIQASTNFIKNDIAKHFSDLGSKSMIMIPEGVDLKAFQVDPGIDVIGKYRLPIKFLFFPGQLWPHKNHITVLKALLHLRDSKGLDVPLVLTGAKFGAASEIFSFIAAHQMTSVHYLGKVPFDDLRSLYHRAYFLITAVLYESSSLPILEAAASGTPVIASRVGSNLEMANTFQLNLFDAKDPVALAGLIQHHWMDDENRKIQIESNLKASQRFDWSVIAVNYWESMRTMVHRA